jgi:predicted dithiol-disulfide oxidoreductase (DUF899 family)
MKSNPDKGRPVMQPNKIVSREEWIAARQVHLAEEKELTRLRDRLSQSRRRLPWVRVDKEHLFEGPDGKESLADLFAGRGQLIVYHFMYGPDWEEGCPSCSYLCDNIDGSMVHLNHRDVTMVAVSRAPFDKLEAYRKRMGWKFKWVSSHGGDFNHDYDVSFTAEEMAKGEVTYNYKKSTFPSDEAPGLSVFYRHGHGDIFHTYSAYARGLDALICTYNYLDLVPKGRDESDLPYSMAWIRRHDQYED